MRVKDDNEREEFLRRLDFLLICVNREIDIINKEISVLEDIRIFEGPWCSERIGTLSKLLLTKEDELNQIEIDIILNGPTGSDFYEFI